MAHGVYNIVSLYTISGFSRVGQLFISVHRRATCSCYRYTDYVTVLANVRQQLPLKLFLNVYGGTLRECPRLVSYQTAYC